MLVDFVVDNRTNQDKTIVDNTVVAVDNTVVRAVSVDNTAVVSVVTNTAVGNIVVVSVVTNTAVGNIAIGNIAIGSVVTNTAVGNIAVFDTPVSNNGMIKQFDYLGQYMNY
jgi:hypothetical protein